MRGNPRRVYADVLPEVVYNLLKMADSVNDVPVVNITGNDTAANTTAKIPATPEGMAVAYGSLLIMAIVPIFVGAFRSVKYQIAQKVNISPYVCCCEFVKFNLIIHNNVFINFFVQLFK